MHGSGSHNRPFNGSGIALFDGVQGRIAARRTRRAKRSPHPRRDEASGSIVNGEQAFLARQRLLCQKAIEAPDPATIAAPRVPAPVTAAPAADCGPRALQYVCDALRVETTVPTLAKRAGLNARGTTLAGLERAARSYGLKTEGVQMDRNALAHLRTPALAWWQGDHFVAILSVRTSPVTGQSTATIHDPNQNNEEEKPLGELLAQSGGVLLTIARP